MSENQIKENNIDNLEEEEEYEEEEEDDDDISELKNDKKIIVKKEESNFFLNNEEKNIVINNKDNIDNIDNNINEEKEEEVYKNNKERNEGIEEVKDSLIIDENKKFDDEKIIREKENKLKEMTNKTIIDYFEIFYSDNNEKEKFNDIYMNTKDLIDNYDKFESKIKEKILTFICIIFPFCTKEQKKNLSKINIEDENIKKFLLQTLLFFEEKYKLYKILILIPTKNTKKTERLEIKNDLLIKLDSDLFALYQFMIIYRSLNTKKEKNKKTFDNRFYMIDFYFISSKIYYILSHYKLYPNISDDILFISKRMLFIKKFYSSAFTKKIEEPYIISMINKFENEYKEYSINQIINEIFDKEEKIINDNVIKYIKHFYKINDESDLLYYSNNKLFKKMKIKYNFVENITNIIYLKHNSINNEDNMKIKEILNCLERNIREKYLNKKKEKEKNKNQIKKIYNELTEEIIEYFKKEKIENLNFIKFYPIELLSPFLSNNELENELIIIFDIFKLNNYYRNNILNKLENFLTDKYKAKKELNTNNFKFDFKSKKINIIICGYSLYIQSIIFRAYSLIDERFLILNLTLYRFLKKIDLVEKNNKCSEGLFFQYLLIAFLQDIIKPPILPKILSKDILNVQKIPFEFDSKEKKYKYKCMHIPKIIFDKEKMKNIYDETIGTNKNKISCAEIFLLFLEFIIFYYKFDSIYTDISKDYEGFNSINNLINQLYIDEEDNNYENINPNNIYFEEYFYDKYSQNNDDNIILIKTSVEPFHVSSLNKNNFQKFYEKIKKGYEILINSGSFDDLDKLNKKSNNKK